MKFKTRITLLALLLVCSAVLGQDQAKKELEIVDDDENEPPKPKEHEIKSDLDLPQFYGARFIEEIKAEDFEAKTQDTGNVQNLIFFGADWCPHCRSFVPEFNILAHSIEVEAKGKGKYKFYRCYPGENNKDLLKKFKVDSYPTILLIKNNKVWTYRGERRSDPVLEWTKNLNPDMAVPYPDHVPGFTEELWEVVEDVIKSIKVAYRREPTKMTYFFIAIGGILLLFLACFFYAIYEACFGSEDEVEARAKNKEKTD